MNYEGLLQYALRILSKKRYTSVEMSGKLDKFCKKTAAINQPLQALQPLETLKGPGLPASEPKRNDRPSKNANSNVEKVLARLEELKYLNDEQYARDYITTRIKLRPRGQFLLARELKIKGISEEDTKKILTEQNINEAELAKNALEKRIRQWKTLPPNRLREKAFRFLSARGFTQDAIYKALGSCYYPATEQDLY